VLVKISRLFADDNWRSRIRDIDDKRRCPGGALIKGAQISWI
jgi:hypothetical protein